MSSSEDDSSSNPSAINPPMDNREGGNSNSNSNSNLNSNPTADDSDATAKTNNYTAKQPQNSSHHSHKSSWASGSFSDLFGWESPTHNITTNNSNNNDNQKPPLPKRNLEAEFHDKNRRFLLQAEREKMRQNSNAPPVQFPRAAR
jgi:hypothetical protein